MGDCDIISDEHAVMGLPIYLLVAIIVAAAVVAVFSLAMYNLWLDAQIHHVEREVDKIVSEAENMFEYADEGTLVTVHVEFPTAVRYLVFGGLPKNAASEPDTTTLDENTSNNYYFVMTDGRLYTAHTHARFSGENTSQIAMFHYGVYDMTLELVKEDDGRTYVKIY